MTTMIELTQHKMGPARVRRDGEAIVIDIPMTFRRRSGRKEIILPPGATAAPPKPTGPLALALARAFRWQEMIESGEATSVSDLARRLRLDQSFAARTIRLASLAPDIVEAILGECESDNFSLRLLRKDLPLLWEAQREACGHALRAPAQCPRPMLQAGPSRGDTSPH